MKRKTIGGVVGGVAGAGIARISVPVSESPRLETPLQGPADQLEELARRGV